jgi:hypothetical protein
MTWFGVRLLGLPAVRGVRPPTDGSVQWQAWQSLLGGACGVALRCGGDEGRKTKKAHDGARTRGCVIKSHTLYRLSYVGVTRTQGSQRTSSNRVPL